MILTPTHRLRQLELSLFFKGQTTSLVSLTTEKELVREDRGGMMNIAGEVGGWWMVDEVGRGWKKKELLIGSYDN